MHPRYLKEILGRKAAIDLSFGKPLDFTDIEPIPEK